MSTTKPVLSIKDTAAELQLPPATVRALITKGALKAQRQGRRYWITRPCLEAFLRGERHG